MNRKFILLFGLMFFLSFSSTLFSQDSLRRSRELDLEKKEFNKKIQVIKSLQDDLFSLTYDLDHIVNVIVPEVQAKRSELAPHYPDVQTLAREENIINQSFIDWVKLYPQEYNAFKIYLEGFLASH